MWKKQNYAISRNEKEVVEGISDKTITKNKIFFVKNNDKYFLSFLENNKPLILS